MRQVPVPRRETTVEAEGIEGGASTHEDLRDSAKSAESQERGEPQVDPHRSSADESVTERVTVPVDALAVLVKLARRFDDDPAIAAALTAVARGGGDEA